MTRGRLNARFFDADIGHVKGYPECPIRVPLKHLRLLED